MKTKLAVTTMAILLLVGCANFSTTQTDRRFNDDGTVSTEITTKAAARTFFAGKSALANWKATQTEKTQGAEVGKLDSEVSGVGTEIGTIIGTGIAAGVTALKPAN